MEQQTVVAAFDRPDQAQEAMDALLESGFSRSQTRLGSAEEVMDSDARLQSSASGRRESENLTLTQKIARFFGFEDDDETTATYSEVMRRGSVVVVVDADTEDEAQRATSILGRFGPIDIDQRVSEWRATGWQPERTERATAARTDEQATIPVVEEQLRVGTRVVQGGGVRIFSRTREIPVEERVELREERAKVTRRPADRPVTDQDRPFEEKSFEVLESREEPVVGKTARVVEEVVVGKETRQREERVRDSVRKTEVEVQQAAEQPRQPRPDRQRD
jgi:stress response protein YsnF